MTYQAFLKTLYDLIQRQFPEDTKITIQPIRKNNGTIYDGLTIFCNQLNVSPTIYLNSYYLKYMEGVSVKEICNEILTEFHKLKPTENMDVSFFTDYQKVKERLVFKLVNYAQNQILLSDVPHICFLDLALVFYCFLPQSRDYHATILIHNHHLKLWGISTDTLCRIAMQNTPRLLPWQLDDMRELLMQTLSEKERPPFDFKDGPAMYILSNCDKRNGASALCYDGLLLRLSEEFHSDFLILPSSIHEVILIPDSDTDNFQGLNEMIREINETQLADEEVLSNHAYYFSRKQGQIIMP